MECILTNIRLLVTNVRHKIVHVNCMTILPKVGCLVTLRFDGYESQRSRIIYQKFELSK